jgi:ATP-binding protein involved in chromosome partitioning
MRFMKSYHDIQGDGGSRILEQVAGQQARIDAALSGVRHLLAIGSGKGGVGKSTLTLQLASVLAGRGSEVAVLDADFNGPTQARLAGVQAAVPLPGPGTMVLPRARAGFGVFSMGSLVPETRAVEFESQSRGSSYTWRATREFTLLGEILGSVAWGRLDVLLLDLPPGAERIVQFAEFLGPRARFVLVGIPSRLARGVVLRSAAALAGAGRPALGYIENMDGYACDGCGEVRPLFPRGDGDLPGLPCLGRVPFDPELAALCDRGVPITESPDLPSARALAGVAGRLLESLEVTS